MASNPPIEWPTNLKVGIIRQWPADIPLQRLRSLYRDKEGDVIPVAQTVRDLKREVSMLNGVNPVLLMALRDRDIRQDGMPRADASPEHPGVIFTFEADGSTFSFPCGRWATWPENLRAVALTMEALRAPDRHGAVKLGAQYQGFKELESGIAVGTGITTVTAALEVLGKWSGLPALSRDDSPATLARAVNLATRAVHPDAHPEVDPDAFQRVQAAAQYLRTKGHLS